MKLKDAEKWKKTVDNNTDDYGSCGVQYAERWANLMEKKMGDGAKLEDIAEDASHEADRQGMTGFMYGCAVSILSEVWKHGEQLRRWHNLKTQIGAEGEKANASGGVLNPALVYIDPSLLNIDAELRNENAMHCSALDAKPDTI